MTRYGSSRIKTLVLVATGGVGPTGATGATGNTGAYVTGPNGIVGTGVYSIEYSSVTDGITFTLTDNSSIYFTGIRGNTGIGPAPYPKVDVVGSGISLINNTIGQNSGYTLYFKTITLSSGLSGSISGNVITIEDNGSVTGSFDIGELLSVDYSSPSNTYFLDSSNGVNYDEYNYSGNTYSNLDVTRSIGRDFLDGNNFNYSTGSAQGQQHSGLTLLMDAAFYGITGTENGLTSGTWNPYLRFRTSYFDHTGDAGATAITISFSPLGPYTKKIYFDEPIGSCCYCDEEDTDLDTRRKCVDYVSKSYCTSIYGRWSLISCLNRQNSYDCYRRRACCVNGLCLNTSKAKCEQMFGIFDPNNECGASYDCQRGFFGTVAITDSGTTDQPVCCCKDGILVSDNETASQCFARGGVPIDSPPCPSNLCCDESTSLGACCKQDGSCEQLSPQDCASQRGIYRGSGISCSPNPCCNPITT